MEHANYKNSSFEEVEFDFSECENEPIHALGCSQNFAAFVAVESETQKVIAVSDNLKELIGLDGSTLLGQSFLSVRKKLGLSEKFQPSDAGCFLPVLNPNEPAQLLNNAMFYVYAHRHAGQEIWEFEPAEKFNGRSMFGYKNTERPWQKHSKADENISILWACQLVAEEFRNLTGFERTMVYRFHPDQSGDVVAEIKKPEAISYLGLRYPATDIPSQARRLFMLNPVRVIFDVNSPAVSILQNDSESEVDCSYLQSRGVSPYHVQYLQNMGVIASIACSILVKGELWGLMIGHHSEPYAIAPAGRQLALDLVVQLSGFIEKKSQELVAAEVENLQSSSDYISKYIDENAKFNLIGSLFFGMFSAVDLGNSHGIAVVMGDEYVCVGKTPQHDQIESLLRWVEEQHPIFQEQFGRYFYTQDIPKAYQRGHSIRGLFCVSSVFEGLPCSVLLFRTEWAEQVLWGGDPSEPVSLDENLKLSPRNSFGLWCESVAGLSHPWESKVINNLKVFYESILSRMTKSRLQNEFSELVDSFNQTYSLNNYFLTYFVSSFGGSSGLLLLELLDDGDFNAIFVNQKFRELFDIGSMQVMLNDVHNVLRSNESFFNSILIGEKPKIELWSAYSGQRIVGVDKTEALSFKGKEQLRHFMLIHFCDITLETRTLEAMQVARDQSRFSGKLQQEMLSNVSHELRTPLNAVLGLTELLKTSSLTEEQHEFVAEIGIAGTHLLQLVTNMLDLSNLESGRILLKNESQFGLMALVNETIALNRVFAESSEVFVTMLSFDASMDWQILADKVRVRQTMINVLNNAIKYTPAKGRVEVKVLSGRHGGVDVEVSDTGIGIPAKDLSRVFDRFYRVTHSEFYREGAGIGLSLTKMFMELHGGTVLISSQENRGTTVTLSFPKSRVISQPFNCDVQAD